MKIRKSELKKLIFEVLSEVAENNKCARCGCTEDQHDFETRECLACGRCKGFNPKIKEGGVGSGVKGHKTDRPKPTNDSPKPGSTIVNPRGVKAKVLKNLGGGGANRGDKYRVQYPDGSEHDIEWGPGFSHAKNNV